MKKIKEQNLYIPYNLCLKMKDLGFDWVTFNCYWEPVKGTGGYGLKHDKIPKVLYDQAFAWFRERGIHGEIVKTPKVNGWVYSVINDNDDNKRVCGKGNVYEDVRLECLIKCLEELISFYGEES